MPLPRPITGLVGNPTPGVDSREEEQQKRPKRPPAPISAFSFQLATPSKHAHAKDMKRESVAFDTPTRYSTPLREVSTSLKAEAGPSKPRRPLNSLPSPYGGPPFKPMTPAVKLENGKRMSDMQWGSAKLLGKRKDTTEGEAGPVGSPSKPLTTLGQLGKVDLGENLHVEEVKKRVEEEGIGVSPRGKKIIKYSGKGPPPLSFILNSALSSQQSSLVLFYASMQSTLYPRLTPKKTRITPSALASGALQPIPKGPTVIQHLRTAPLVMSVQSVIEGRTGWSVMCRCKLNKGHASQQTMSTEKGKPPEDPQPFVDGDVALDDQPADRNVTDILVALQQVPQDCARLGLDPRILSLKPPKPGGVSYEIGVWPAWSDTVLEDHLLHGPDQALATPDHLYHQVVFASRYLIAESAARV